MLTRRLRNRDWGRIAQWRPNPAQHRLTRTSRSVNLPGRGSNRKQKSAPANRAEGAPRRLPRGRRSARLLTYPPAWVAERAVPTARAAPPDKFQCVRAGARTRVCIRRRNAYSSKWYAGGRRFDWVRPYTSRGADTLGKLRPQSYRFAPKPNGMGLGMQMRTECDVLTRKRAHRLQTKPNTPETNRLGPRGAGRRAPGPGRTAHRPRRTTPRRPASVHGTGTPPPRPLPPLGGPRRAPPPSSPHGRPPGSGDRRPALCAGPATAPRGGSLEAPP